MRRKENNYVYSLRITREERDLLKRSPNIKQDLNKIVKEYLGSFLELEQKNKS